jgi:hypothetical protein
LQSENRCIIIKEKYFRNNCNLKTDATKIKEKYFISKHDLKTDVSKCAYASIPNK